MMFWKDETYAGEFSINISSLPEWREELLSIVIKDYNDIKISKSDELTVLIKLSDDELYDLGKKIADKISIFKNKECVILSEYEGLARLWVLREEDGGISLNGFCESSALSDSQSEEILNIAMDYITSRKLLSTHN